MRVITLILSALLLIAPVAVLAAGLDDATNAIETFKTFLYGFLGVGALAYMIYQVILAGLDKQPWGDVLIALGKVAVAGGCVVAAEWAWSIWGS